MWHFSFSQLWDKEVDKQNQAIYIGDSILALGPVAQLVEHRPFKAMVVGSSPAWLTYKPDL